MIKHKILLFLIVIIIFSFSSFAQNKDTAISGFITDAVTGEVLYGANIIIYKDTLNFDLSPLSGTVSNSYGFYTFPKISVGTYFLIIRYLGYKPVIDSVEVFKSDISIQKNFKMYPENIKLEEIIVTGEKDDEAKISTITLPPEALNKLPTLSGEAALFNALELLPGVQSLNEISSGLYVRGGSPDQNLTLIDGVIFYNPSHLGNFTSSFNSDAVQSIKLIKGALPAEYGGRLSSVLDIRLRSGTKEKNKGVLGLGTLSSRLLLEGPLGEKATYLISGRKMYYDVLQKEFFDNNIIPRYNYHDINSKITYNISDRDILWIEGNLSRDNIYNPSSDDGSDYSINWENNSFILNWLKINSKSVFLNNSLSYVDYRFRSIINSLSGNSESGYFSSSILRDLILKLSAEVHFNESHKLKMGTEIAAHNYNLIYNNYYNEILEKTLNSEQGIIATEAALYFENEIKILPSLLTNIGGRFYYFNSKKYLKFEPRISAVYSFSDNLNINAAYSVAHQFLHLIIRNDISLPTDLWYPSSDEITPAKASQYVFGIDSYFEQKEYKFSIEAYYKEMQNLYEFESSPSINTGIPLEDLLTSGDGEAYGIEFFLNKRKGKFSGWIGYTLSWTKRKFDELNAGKVFYPRYDRRHDLSIVLSYSLLNNFDVGVSWIYATGQGYTVPTGQYQFPDIGLGSSPSLQIDYTGRNEFRLPAYHKLDFFTSYKLVLLGLPCEIYLNLHNVYNRQNAFAYYTSYGSNEQSKNLVLKKIVLFPFIPTAGINIQF